MNIKKLITPLHILEEKYLAKAGKDWYLRIDRRNESNDDEGFKKCCHLDEIKRNKDNRMQLYDLVEKYYDKYYSGKREIFNKWIIINIV